MKKRKSWWEKLADAKDLPKVVKVPPGMRARWETGTVVIPSPIEVDQIMRKVYKGKLITIKEIQESLTGKHGATISCPITPGIFARIADGAAEEDEAEGKKRTNPYWRTLKSGGELNPKYPGGIESQRAKLEAEGHRMICRGKRYFVRDPQRSGIRG